MLRGGRRCCGTGGTDGTSGTGRFAKDGKFAAPLPGAMTALAECCFRPYGGGGLPQRGVWVSPTERASSSAWKAKRGGRIGKRGGEFPKRGCQTDIRSMVDGKTLHEEIKTLHEETPCGPCPKQNAP